MTPRVIFVAFNLLLLPLYPLLAAYTLWRRYVQKKSPESLAAQWGTVPASVSQALAADASTLVIWIHAVSVGEQMAAAPIARALRSELPHSKILLTATTDTGFAIAQKTMQSGAADAAWYFPLDVPFAVQRALVAVRPDCFLAVETELWPNFLHLAGKCGVLCALVNGRVSDNLLKNAKRTRWLWRWMFSNLQSCLMRSHFDTERMRDIANTVGAPDALTRIVTCGDVKLEGLLECEDLQRLRMRWCKQLRINDNELLLVCGSTHPGEEEMLLRSFKELLAEYPQLKLLIAPRHVERTAEVFALIKSENFDVVKRSEINSQNSQIILLDTIGELADIYAAADVAFVGGSLIPRGGHNVLEPVLRGSPVVFGPFMANFRAAADLVQNAKLGNLVQNEEDLLIQLKRWLKDEAARKELPEQARRTLAPHQNASARIAAVVARRLSQQVKSKLN